jgi:cobalt-zinc-cadmium efflux system membrane fusion protein
MKTIIFSILFWSAFFISCSHAPNTDVVNDRSILDSLIKQSNLVYVKERPVISTLDLSGKISIDENRSPRIFPLASGIVMKVLVELGDRVNKGQLLATIKSPELLDAQRDYKNAEVELLNQEKNIEAAKSLAKAGLMSEKEFTITQNQLQISKNNLQKSKELLSIYNQGSNPDEFNIYAPISGYIIEKNISANSQFQGSQSQSLFTVSDLNEIYADANVYESDINKVHLNDSVYITTLAYPDKVFKGIVSKIIDVLNPQTKTMCVRVKLKNNGYLKPEMYAEMSINYNSGQIMKAIPKSAVVFDNSLNYVVVQQGDSAVVRKILVQSTDKTYTYFEGDVKPNERVSTKDALMIYNAINN